MSAFLSIYIILNLDILYVHSRSSSGGSVNRPTSLCSFYLDYFGQLSMGIVVSFARGMEQS
ncbi:MAG: hypothetical protein LH679_05250 [Cyanobacteria bacterium CAN_BIN43]|nr:hypothetical protein [Cyanobacteria bacterium CAN_BIN43]